jgi:hypothetical protein
MPDYSTMKRELRWCSKKNEDAYRFMREATELLSGEGDRHGASERYG